MLPDNSSVFGVAKFSHTDISETPAQLLARVRCSRPISQQDFTDLISVDVFNELVKSVGFPTGFMMCRDQVYATVQNIDYVFDI